MKRMTLYIIIFLGIVLLCYYVVISKPNPEKRYILSCVNNLKHIYSALHQYADNNQGYYPVDNTMSTLVKGSYIAKDFFVCNALLVRHPDADERESYEFFTEGKKDIDDIQVMVRDKYGNHKDGSVNILYRDGVVLNSKWK